VKQDYRQLLKPEIINTVSGMALISRIIVDGYLNGLNHSRRVGAGMEFSQFRGYEPGDDLRLLDWKMLARSGRYYIKQSEIETNISIKFILDTSKSMLHKEDNISKMDMAKVLIASLAYLSQNQGDAIGLFALNENRLHSIQPKIQIQHFNRMLLELINIEPEGKWPQNANESFKLHDSTHKELIFFITDMYEHEAELTSFIKRLKTLRNEVVVLHLMGTKELEFDYKGTLTFEDLETGTKLKVDAKAAKKQYLKLLDDKMKTTKDLLLSNNISYQLFNLQEPLAEALQMYLKRRKKLM
jgi:uncharacterized protein (DUF58 family)